MAQGFYGGGLIAAAPLYAIVNVDRLDLSLADVGIIGILTAGATTLSLPALGRGRRPTRSARRDADRQRARAGRARRLCPGARRSRCCGSPPIAAGAGSASIDVGIASAVSDHTPLASRAAAMAGWNAITGARGIVAAFTMSILLQVGIVDVTTGLLLCAGGHRDRRRPVCQGEHDRGRPEPGARDVARDPRGHRPAERGQPASAAARAIAAYPQMSPIVKPSGNGSVGSTT